MDLLTDLQIVDLSTNLAGAYASRLFADCGAHVVKVEPPTGNPLRGASGEAPLYRFLAASIESVVGDLDSSEVRALVARADLLIESYENDLPPFDPAPLLEAHPQLVVLSLTRYGRRGPWVNRPATEFVVQAEAGAIAMHGFPHEIPYQTGGRLLEWAAGTYSAVGALAAVLRARHSGVGELVECPQLLATAFSSLAFVDAMQELVGEPAPGTVARYVDLPSVEPTVDGWIGLKIFTNPQFEAFCLLIERPDLIDTEWERPEHRLANLDEWNSMVHAFTRAHTTEEVLELAAALRVPATTVNNAQMLLDHEHLRAREFFERSADGQFTQPGVPFLFDGQRPKFRRGSPKLGEHTGVARLGNGRVERDGGVNLSGLRVLDLTSMVAGPVCGQLFAAWGADVIHVESPRHLDGMRRFLAPEQIGCDLWWERAGAWLAINRNKRSLTIALDDADGRAALRRLIGQVDVVIENFSPRVMDGFGFSANDVRQVNPRAVYVRMPAFGLTGPWRDRTGFGQTMEQASGMAWLTGYPGGPPRVINGQCDFVAGSKAAFAALVALRERERTGKGALVEVAMFETALACAAELVIEYTANGRELMRSGNRSDTAAPQGIYRCAGDEQWLALSIVNDDHWSAFTSVAGQPAWATKPEFATAEGRRASADEIDCELSAWALAQSCVEVVDSLIKVGVPAGRARDPRLAKLNPQIAALGYYETLDDPIVGPHGCPSLPFRYQSVAQFGTAHAPLLGADNVSVLEDLLGFTPPETAELARRGVIATRPYGT